MPRQRHASSPGTMMRVWRAGAVFMICRTPDRHSERLAVAKPILRATDRPECGLGSAVTQF